MIFTTKKQLLSQNDGNILKRGRYSQLRYHYLRVPKLKVPTGSSSTCLYSPGEQTGPCVARVTCYFVWCTLIRLCYRESYSIIFICCPQFWYKHATGGLGKAEIEVL